MAKLTPMGFTGRIANVIHYRVGDNFYARIAPGKFKQTKATKMRAGEFGRASTIGCTIRGMLHKAIPDPSDRKMHGRLVAVLFQWIQTFDSKGTGVKQAGIIEDFSFTENKKTIRERWKIALQLKNPSPGLLQVYIPGFVPNESISAPARTVSVICRIATGILNVSTGMPLNKSFSELVFDFNGKRVEEQTISIKMPTPKDSLILTGISLTYRTAKSGNESDNRNKDLMPAGIVHALYI